jgi:hypothetical protein
MLDSGSEVTCIDENLAKEMKAKPLTEPKTQNLKYLDRKVSVVTQLVQISISSTVGDEIATVEAWTIPNLSKGLKAINWNEEKDKWSHLQPITFPELPDDCRIQLLIGNNYPGFFLPEEIAKGKEFQEPFGYLTPFGWTVLGGNKRKYTIIESKCTGDLKRVNCLTTLFSKARQLFSI